ncbi:hypothetical protein C1645_743422 [Glomus cerebriforme]|uniref:Zinc-ribbon domain-containing protein n=1 Tax=Glomus cerebriforme TaxID=658196 RepID=A0A397S9G5_9GLOM|nr:hypothetical protein C1645_743422 [Glomus cerebriforme]
MQYTRSKTCYTRQKNYPVQRHDQEEHVTHQPIDIANSIAQKRGGKCLSKYVNASTQMLWRCAKGHEWSTTLYRMKNMGRWCTQCAGNLPCGLMEAKEITHSRGDFLKTPEHPRGLELDIYYPQYGFAIEIQGKQHEQHVKHFHKDPEEFEKQLMRDQLKKEICEKNLIVLRYVMNWVSLNKLEY